MTVTTYDPTNQVAEPFAITKAAVAHLAKQLDVHDGAWLRLGVSESGCNGFMYTMDYVEEPADDDLTYEQDGLNIVVRASELVMIRGTQIDFVTEGLNSSLKFKNPNAASHCGCGESFSLANVDADAAIGAGAEAD